MHMRNQVHSVKALQSVQTNELVPNFRLIGQAAELCTTMQYSKQCRFSPNSSAAFQFTCTYVQATQVMPLQQQNLAPCRAASRANRIRVSTLQDLFASRTQYAHFDICLEGLVCVLCSQIMALQQRNQV